MLGRILARSSDGEGARRELKLGLAFTADPATRRTAVALLASLGDLPLAVPALASDTLEGEAGTVAAQQGVEPDCQQLDQIDLGRLLAEYLVAGSVPVSAVAGR